MLCCGNNISFTAFQKERRRNGNNSVTSQNEAHGKLLVVYHGTNADFNVFASGDVGYHVGTKEQAENRISDMEYDNGRIIQLYANIKNLVWAAFDFGDWHGNTVASMFIETEQFDYLDNQEEVEAMLEKIAAMDPAEADKALPKYLKELGFDGIKYENYFEGDSRDFSYIAFDSSQLKNTDNGKPTVSEDIRYSDRDSDTEAFRADIDTWYRNGMQENESFTLGYTGDVIQGLGAIESDIYMYGDKIKKILSEHQEMSIDEIKKILDILNDPAMILSSRNSNRRNANNLRLVVFGSVKARNGQPVMVIMDLRAL